MENIVRQHLIDTTRLSGENYFSTLVQEANNAGILTDPDVERLQVACLDFLANRCEKYSGGDSSSVRVEIAENIMKSNLYTMGIYLKSLSDADFAAEQLKAEKISDMYQKGQKIIENRMKSSKHVYMWTKSNKIDTPNYTYNATIGFRGIGNFFRMYRYDFQAHETPASIDYQICNPVKDLTGVEYIQKYIQNLYCENEFCGLFDAQEIDHLLFGFDEGYKDLLINIFEKVLTASLGNVMLGNTYLSLQVSIEEIKALLEGKSPQEIGSIVDDAAKQLLRTIGDMKITVLRYIEKSIPGITRDIVHAMKTNTLHILFPKLKNPDIVPKIQFVSDEKMGDNAYREIIEEMLCCRTSADKIAMVKEKIHTFGDLNDMLLDADFNDSEMDSVFNMVGDVELAALMNIHSTQANMGEPNLPEDEEKLSSNLEKYVGELEYARQKRINEIRNRLITEED